MEWNKEKKTRKPHACARIYLLGAVFTGFVLTLLVRFFYLQVRRPDPWRSMAPAQYESRMKLPARRGQIFDRELNVLAGDVPVYSLAADPSIIGDFQKAGASIASVLRNDARHFIRQLEKDKGSRFVRLWEQITDGEYQQLKSLNLRGLIFLEEQRRTYPFGIMARPVIGWTDARHEGVAGVELAFNDVLSGQDGWKILQRDGLNRNFSTVDYPLEPALDGKNLVLTLDNVYQTVVEEEVKKGVEKYRAKWGAAVLMHPVTGEILSMVSLLGSRLAKENPDFQTTIRNRVIQDNFEPGSVFKMVTMAAVLNEGLFTPETLIYCENGSYSINGSSIRDDNRSFQWLTATQAMQVSSNIALSKMAKKLGKQKLYKYIQDFGFGNSTGIGLPGEAAGLLRPPYQWDDFLTATMSFGQGLSVTCVQLACMASVIANGGELIKPRLYREIIDDGHRVPVDSREKIRNVITQETARRMTDILEKCVTHGTGEKASVPGLRIAGKTGTAQKSAPGIEGYISGAHVTSFVGFWPANAPQFVLVVTLDEPRPASLSSQNAAPIFAAIARRISGLPMSSPVPVPENEAVPSVFTLSSSEVVTASLPATAVAEQKSGQTVSPHFVPDMKGMSLRQALRMLAVCQITASVEGHGIVCEQDLTPGIRVEKNMICRLKCR
ncbi:transpeptidase family protein [bacterium]|nr:transpeptidase family protein [bacterium]